MPRRELKNGKQVADWLASVGSQLKAPGNMTLIRLGKTHWIAWLKLRVTLHPCL
jgi:hypothetical protein